VSHPLDTVKVRMQIGSTETVKIIPTIKSIYHREGVRQQMIPNPLFRSEVSSKVFSSPSWLVLPFPQCKEFIFNHYLVCFHHLALRNESWSIILAWDKTQNISWPVHSLDCKYRNQEIFSVANYLSNILSNLMILDATRMLPLFLIF